MRVKMLRTMKGSPNGHNVYEYEAGCEYSIPESLAAVFVDNKWAVYLMAAPKPTIYEETREEKNAKMPQFTEVKPPSNKAYISALSNKKKKGKK